MTERPSICVVIPSFQGGDSLLECLGTLAKSSYPPQCTIVIDNASTDGSVEAAMQTFPNVEFYVNDENEGFGASCNRGMQIGLDRDVDYIFLLNQDALLEVETLESLVSLAQRIPKAGALGPKTLCLAMSHTSSSSVRTPKLHYNGAYRTWLPLWQRIPGYGKPDNPSDNQPRQVDYLWGHAMLLRSDALREVGLFDPGFFMYCEDLDLCLRLQRAGWQTWCDSAALTWHGLDDEAKKEKSEPWRWYLKQSSSHYFYHKTYRPWHAQVLWLLTALRESISLARHRQWKSVCDLFGAVWKILIGVRVPPPKAKERR
jgi:N-acetylglucosaminyl-diphospho-decaprenol L-rhamnosyltransferase